MMKDVIISIKSVQNGENGEDAIDFMTDGLYSFDGDTSCLTYMESEVTGLEGTRTSVMVLPDQVVVDRDGNLTSRMIFKEGMKNAFIYNTPFGQATLGLDTRRIKHSFGEKGGHMEIDYVVDLEHSMVSRNKFFVEVKEQNMIGDNTNG